MRKSRFTETQIFKILNEASVGMKTAEICRKHGISQATFYKWKAKYGGMDISDARRLREVEEENRRLKQMYAELSLLHEAYKDAVEKNL